MTKTAFLDSLRHRLHGLSDKDILNSLDFYAEMIDDRMESGMAEEDAVACLGKPEEIAREIILNLPLPKVIQSKCRKRNPWRAWEIVLLVLGSPIWLSLVLVGVAVLLSVYAVLWAAVACLWAVDAAFGGMALGCVVAGAVNVAEASLPSALLYAGVALVSAGLAIVAFLGCLRATVLFAKLTAHFGRWVKSRFVREGSRHVEG